MPTTVVKTIRASGGDYTTLTAWEAANQGDLVAADEVRVAECYNDWPSGLDDKLVIDGSTTDATRYLMITVAAGHRHTGIPQSGFYLKKNVGFDTLIRDSDPYTRLAWLDVENTNSNGQALFANAGSGTYSSLIAKTVGAAQYAVGLYGNGITVHGTLAYGSGTGFQINTAVAANIYNSVATGCAKGFNTGSALAVLKNCTAYNNTINYSGTFDAASTNNATSSASDDAPGASSVVGITSADFVDAAGNDYHLAAGSALIGAGANLYADFQADVDGDAWPSSGAWDVGFDYRVASGSANNLEAAESGADAAAFAGTIRVAGTLAATEAVQDAAALTGGVLVSGGISAQESGADSANIHGSGFILATGNFAATEAGTDVTALTGGVRISGSVSATESGADSANIHGSGLIIAIGNVAATEAGPDVAAFAGQVLLLGQIAAIEVDIDSAAMTGALRVSGAVAAVEAGADVAAFLGEGIDLLGKPHAIAIIDPVRRIFVIPRSARITAIPRILPRSSR